MNANIKQIITMALNIGGIVTTAFSTSFRRSLLLKMTSAGFNVGKEINKLDLSSFSRWYAFPISIKANSEFKDFTKEQISKNPWGEKHKYKINGFDVFVESFSHNSFVNISCNLKDKDKITKILKNLIWKNHNSLIRLSLTSDPSACCFENDKLVLGQKTEQYEELLKYCALFLDKKINRSILLYGNPGTGKTTLARLIAEKLNLKTIIIPVEELAKIDINIMTNIVNFLEPEAIIIDDFEKDIKNVALPAILEVFKSSCKFVFVTANDLDYLKKFPYLIRPGRFDKLVEIKQADSAVILELLGKDFEEYYEDVKLWPIAYIQEVKNVCYVLGKDKAKETILELQERIDLSKKDKNS